VCCEVKPKVVLKGAKPGSESNAINLAALTHVVNLVGRFCREKRSFRYKHAVPITIETVFLFNGMGIGTKDILAAGKGA
jgi:hypothetical protein